MPRYFMHLVDNADYVSDEQGVELEPHEVHPAALAAARDCMAADVLAGRLKLTSRIEVTDEHGFVVDNMPFAEAVEIDRSFIENGGAF